LKYLQGLQNKIQHSFKCKFSKVGMKTAHNSRHFPWKAVSCLLFENRWRLFSFGMFLNSL